MKLLILGATGGTGHHLVTQALDAGHQVTVFARDPAKVTTKHDRLRTVGGVMTEHALTPVMGGHDAAISAIGRGLSFKSEGLIAQTVPVILSAMKEARVRRLIFMSALGVGASWQDSPLLPRIFFSTLLRGIYADKAIGDRLIQGSDLDWTIVQPAQLNDGPLTGNYRFGERLKLKGMASISRADTAQFILAQLEDRTNIRKTIIVST